jgi:hypothetical protein
VRPDVPSDHRERLEHLFDTRAFEQTMRFVAATICESYGRRD